VGASVCCNPFYMVRWGQCVLLKAHATRMRWRERNARYISNMGIITQGQEYNNSRQAADDLVLPVQRIHLT